VYILRAEARKNLAGTLRCLAEIGYEGVEMTGFFGAASGALRTMLELAPIEALGDHMPLDAFLKDPEGAVADHLAIGCRRIASPARKRAFRRSPLTRWPGRTRTRRRSVSPPASPPVPQPRL
jgi:hypothetical protein